MIWTVLIGCVCFVLGVVLTALFGVQIAKSAISGEKAMLAEASAATVRSEVRVKRELQAFKDSVHDKLDRLKDHLTNAKS